MKTCAYCGQENETEASACAGCGTELPPSAPPPLQRQQFVRNGEVRRLVARLSRLRQAEFLRDALVAAGLQATIEDQSVRGFLGFVNPVDRILVHVPEGQAGAADIILRNLMPALRLPKGQERPGAPAAVDDALTDPSSNLVVVASCATVVDANIVKSHLMRVGIEACVPEEYNTPIFWYGPATPVGVTVRVKACDEARALQTLEEAGVIEMPPPPPPAPPPPPGPAPIPPPPPILRQK